MRTAMQIRAAILDGTLRPGETLSDAALQRWLGVSRQPIREALHDLARVGLVETAPQRYTRVVEPTREAEPHVRQALLALLGALTSVTIEAADEEIITSLHQQICFEQHRALQKGGHEQGGHLNALSDLIVDSCPNALLAQAAGDMVASLTFQLSFLHQPRPGTHAALERGYEALLAAVRARDAAGAWSALALLLR